MSIGFEDAARDRRSNLAGVIFPSTQEGRSGLRNDCFSPVYYDGKNSQLRQTTFFLESIAA